MGFCLRLLSEALNPKQGVRFRTSNIGAEIITNMILVVPYYDYSRIYPKTLF